MSIGTVQHSIELRDYKQRVHERDGLTEGDTSVVHIYMS